MPAAHSKPKFFFIFPHVLLALVLIGFAPTLYLRSIGDPPPIPFYLHLHGMILTGWYVLLVVQAWLIRKGNTARHRSLGYWLAGYGVVVACGGLMATLNVVARDQGLGITFESDMATVAPELGTGPGVAYLPFISGVVWANIGSVSAFALLLGAAVWQRRRGDWHKRCVVFASMAILPPALARISRWELFGGESPTTITSMLLVLMAAVLVYDLVSLRKVHMATITGFVTILLIAALAGQLATSEFGLAFARSLGS
jgi:hypothetical protein